MICDKCNGTGEPGQNEIDYGKRNRYLWPPRHCDKCHGSGKLDWIEKIVGKKPVSDIITIGSSSIGLEQTATSVSIDQEFKQEIIDEAIEKLTIIIDEKMTKLLEGGKI